MLASRAMSLAKSKLRDQHACTYAPELSNVAQEVSSSTAHFRLSPFPPAPMPAVAGNNASKLWPAERMHKRESSQGDSWPHVHDVVYHLLLPEHRQSGLHA